MKKAKKITITIGLLLLLLVGILFIYFSDAYQPDEVALKALETDAEVVVQGEDPIVFSRLRQPNAEVGIIFYPGGKVESESYALLTRQLAQQGYAVFLVDMPFNLAVFDKDAAAEVMETYPEIKEWYLAGHSLGGSMAAAYAEEETVAISGLILLASYSAADLSATDLPVLSIYGDQDAVLNVGNLIENRVNLPVTYEEILLEGGNHAQFGNYGPQEGDGKATLSFMEQQQITVEAIVRFIEEH